MKFVVTQTAKTSLDEIIHFLKINWTEKEIGVLKNDIKKFKQTIKRWHFKASIFGRKSSYPIRFGRQKTS